MGETERGGEDRGEEDRGGEVRGRWGLVEGLRGRREVLQVCEHME